jgi:hypothetical protein
MTMEEIEFGIKAAVTVTDQHTIAMLAAADFICLLLTVRTNGAFAVFEDTPELRDALKRFKSHRLKVDALECWEALDELNWRLAEEAHDQAQQK